MGMFWFVISLEYLVICFNVIGWFFKLLVNVILWYFSVSRWVVVKVLFVL